MENKTNKPRLKISIFDIVIIAVVIIAAAALIFIWRNSGKSSTGSGNTRPLHYTIELNGMVDGTAEKIKQGDTIMDSDKKYIMGTVQSVNIGPATTPEPNRQTGDTLMAEIPGKEAATIELLCDCAPTESQISTSSGYLIQVGGVVHAAGPGYAGTGYVIAIDREDLGK